MTEDIIRLIGGVGEDIEVIDVLVKDHRRIKWLPPARIRVKVDMRIQSHRSGAITALRKFDISAAYPQSDPKEIMKRTQVLEELGRRIAVYEYEIPIDLQPTPEQRTMVQQFLRDHQREFGR